MALVARPSCAGAQEIPQFIACGTGRSFIAIMSTLRATPGDVFSDPTGLTRDWYDVATRSGMLFVTRATNGRAVGTGVTAGDPKLACFIHPPALIKVNIELGGTLPGVNVGALAAVLAYRRNHPWPLGPAAVDAADTSISTETRNGRLFVFISEYHSYAGQARACEGQEYYRVDLPGFIVRPFDGCIEGHQLHLLPGIRELPP